MYNIFMKKSIIFVNTQGYGDILHSRQGVRWVVEQLGDKFNYYYIHNLNPDCCYIHYNVQVVSLEGRFMAQSMEFVKKSLYSTSTDDVREALFHNALWIDTWAASFEKMSRMPGIGFKLPDENGNYHAGCEEIQDTTKSQAKLYVEKINQINDFLLACLSSKKLTPPDHTAFVCQWNFNPRYKFFADGFLKRTSKFDLRIMICNGNTTSTQRRNFIYEEILAEYIKANQNVCFILTSKLKEIDSPNVFYIDDNFPIPNLDQIEYLMKFCDIIVTSQSGPGCLAFTDAIVFDQTKTLIIFCIDSIQTYFEDGVCEYIRSSDFEDSNVLKVISETIEKKLTNK